MFHPKLLPNGIIFLFCLLQQDFEIYNYDPQKKKNSMSDFFMLFGDFFMLFGLWPASTNMCGKQGKRKILIILDKKNNNNSMNANGPCI